jgi:tRNA-dihydrouridine synthase
MIGQAAIGNPRIFTPHLPTLDEKLETILRHLDVSVACDQLFETYGVILITLDLLEQQIKTNLKNPDFEAHSIVEFRKFLFQYLKGIPDSREWKNQILTIKRYGELRKKITTFFETKQETNFEH